MCIGFFNIHVSPVVRSTSNFSSSGRDTAAPLSTTLGASMAVPPYGDKLVPFLESVGSLEARRLKLINYFHSEDWQNLARWLAIKEVEGKARSDERSEESLSISRQALRNSDKALSNSRLATSIAISAIVLSIIMAIQKLIEWFSR